MNLLDIFMKLGTESHDSEWIGVSEFMVWLTNGRVWRADGKVSDRTKARGGDRKLEQSDGSDASPKTPRWRCRIWESGLGFRSICGFSRSWWRAKIRVHVWGVIDFEKGICLTKVKKISLYFEFFYFPH